MLVNLAVQVANAFQRVGNIWMLDIVGEYFPSHVETFMMVLECDRKVFEVFMRNTEIKQQISDIFVHYFRNYIVL